MVGHQAHHPISLFSSTLVNFTLISLQLLRNKLFGFVLDLTCKKWFYCCSLSLTFRLLSFLTLKSSRRKLWEPIVETFFELLKFPWPPSVLSVCWRRTECVFGWAHPTLLYPLFWSERSIIDGLAMRFAYPICSWLKYNSSENIIQLENSEPCKI